MKIRKKTFKKYILGFICPSILIASSILALNFSISNKQNRIDNQLTKTHDNFSSFNARATTKSSIELDIRDLFNSTFDIDRTSFEPFPQYALPVEKITFANYTSSPPYSTLPYSSKPVFSISSDNISVSVDEIKNYAQNWLGLLEVNPYENNGYDEILKNTIDVNSTAENRNYFVMQTFENDKVTNSKFLFREAQKFSGSDYKRFSIQGILRDDGSSTNEVSKTNFNVSSSPLVIDSRLLCGPGVRSQSYEQFGVVPTINNSFFAQFSSDVTGYLNNNPFWQTSFVIDDDFSWFDLDNPSDKYIYRFLDLGTTTFDINYDGDMDMYPSDIIADIDYYSQYFAFKFKLCTPSIFRNAKFEFVANDGEGTITVRFKPKYYFKNSKVNFSIPLAQGGSYSYSTGNYFKTEMIKYEDNVYDPNYNEISFTISGFNTMTNTTIYKNEINVSNDDRFNLMTIKQFESYPNANSLLNDKIYEERETLFKDLPSDFKKENIININKTIDPNNDKKLIVNFQINNYFNNGHQTKPWDIQVYFTGFSAGATDVLVGDEVTLTNPSDYDTIIPQYGLNIDIGTSTSIDLAYTNPQTEDEINQIIPLSKNELNLAFRLNVFNHAIVSNKKGLSWADIENVKLQFDNSTGSYHIYGITLSKYNDDKGNLISASKWFPTYKIDNANNLVALKFSGLKSITSQDNFILKETLDISGYNTMSVNDIDVAEVKKILTNNYPFIQPNQTNLIDVTTPFQDFFDDFGSVSTVSITSRNANEGTINVAVTFNNVYVDNIFYETYKFDKEIVISGFYANSKNTIISNSSQNWGMKASEAVTTKVDTFKQMFFEKNISNPVEIATYNDIEIINPTYNDSIGELTADFVFNGIYQENGVKIENYKKTMTIGGFEIQRPTKFVTKINLEAPTENGVAINIHDPNLQDKMLEQIKSILDTSPETIITNAPEGVKDLVKIINITPNYTTHQVNFKIELTKYYNSEGILVDSTIDPSIRPLTSEICFMNNFKVNSQTQQNYSYKYNVNKTNEIINTDYFLNPNNYQDLKDIVLTSLNEELRQNRISIPNNLTTQDFTIAINSSKYPNDNDINLAYGTGEINLIINLNRFFDQNGKEVTDSSNPITINVNLYGWKKLNTKFVANSIILTPEEQAQYSTDISKEELAHVVWNHRTEIFNSEVPFFNNQQLFIENIIAENVDLSESNGNIIVKCKITLKKSFSNGLIIENQVHEVLISGFSEIVSTKFFDGSEIDSNLTNILPTDLQKQSQMDIGSLDNDFKLFIIQEIVLPNKIGITTSDIISVTLTNASNIDGSIRLTELKIRAYNGSDKKVEVTFTPTNGSLLIKNLKKISETKLVSNKIDVSATSSLNIFDATELILRRIAIENAKTLFGDTLPSASAISKITINERVYISEDSTDTSVSAPYIKATLTINQYFDSQGILTNGEIPYTVYFYNFNKIVETQLGTIDVNQETVHQVFGNDNMKIFLPSVIDENWFYIQTMLIKLINICYKLQPSKFVSVNKFNSIGDIAYASNTEFDDKSSTGFIYFDKNANWDFLIDDHEKQQQAKDRISLAAKKAIDNPDKYNDFSWGKMQFQLRMINGLVTNKENSEITNGPLNDYQSLLTINCSGFSVLHSSSVNQNSFPSTVLFTIIIAASTIVLLVIAFAIYKFIKRRQESLTSK